MVSGIAASSFVAARFGGCQVWRLLGLEAAWFEGCWVWRLLGLEASGLGVPVSWCAVWRLLSSSSVRFLGISFGDICSSCILFTWGSVCSGAAG